ncbi:TraR/DksA C4-type zinc finger protein [Candidatus Kaiserbacteria bacterium]|nr:TraR/DksA C4-type zinc finger protein [Candidatus Kaiserbacteria bacterium]
MTDIKSKKEKLEELLANITEQLSSVAIYEEKTDNWTAVPETPQNLEADPDLDADTVEDWEARRALMPQLETRYQNIKIALNKIKNKSYGKCEICNELIEEDRLNANPSARTCKTHLDSENQLSIS